MENQKWSYENIYQSIGTQLKEYELKEYDSDEKTVELHTTLDLANLITKIIKNFSDLKKPLYVFSLNLSTQKDNEEINKSIKELINIAFKISLKKEESRFPRFQFYVPIKSNDEKSQEPLTYIIKFAPQIELNKISTLHRISAGIPQRPYAIVVQGEDHILKADGIIRIENTHDSYLKDIPTDHLRGLTISIENPGSLNVLFYPILGVIVQLSFREGRVQVNYDASLNPFAQKIYKSIAQKLSNNENDHSGLTKLIGEIWNYILKLAVEFNHGGQFIIVARDENNQNNSTCVKYLDIKYCVEKEKTNLGKYIKCIYDELKNSQSRDKIKKLTLYQELLDCARLIAHLSTVDGAVVLDDKLDLIGFGAIVRDGNINHYDTPNITLRFQDLYEYIHGKPGNESVSPDRTPNNEQSSCDVKDEKNTKPWKKERFGTRHNSAFKFCALCHQHNLNPKSESSLELKPSVFVVSQDGDIRIFRQCGKPTDPKIGVCGPLRPLWLPFS